MTHPIIAAIDPHRPDDAPLALAARLGRLMGAPVIAAGVVADDGIASAVPTPEWQRMALEHTQEMLDETVARVDAGVPVETHPVVSSSAPRGLHGLAIKMEAGALVAGASHRGPVGRIVPGSMTERLLLGAPCPVAVAPREAVPPGRRITRIGVAYDGSEEARVALSVAQRLAERAGGSVRVLTVMEPAESAGAIWPGPNWAATLDPERIRRIARDRLDEAMNALPAAARGGGEVLHGKPAEQLAEAGAGLDLLVCGSRGYGPARAILLGSVSHALAHRSRCPLLVLPHEAGDTLATLVAPAAEATAG